jgi:hypothetical protein
MGRLLRQSVGDVPMAAEIVDLLKDQYCFRIVLEPFEAAAHGNTRRACLAATTGVIPVAICAAGQVVPANWYATNDPVVREAHGIAISSRSAGWTVLIDTNGWPRRFWVLMLILSGRSRMYWRPNCVELSPARLMHGP